MASLSQNPEWRGAADVEIHYKQEKKKNPPILEAPYLFFFIVIFSAIDKHIWRGEQREGTIDDEYINYKILQKS